MKIFWYRPYADSTKLNFWKFSDINLPIVGSGGYRPIQQFEGWYQKIL